MKIRSFYVYILMTVYFMFVGWSYHMQGDIYGKVCSHMYYTFLYTPLYLYLLSGILKNYFHSIIILRMGSRVRNAVAYIKKIFINTVVFSTWFVICLFFAELSGGETAVTLDIKFYLVKLLIQIFGWTVIGLLQCAFYTIIRDMNVSLVLSWVVCVAMGMSRSVLFRVGRYFYDIFETMTITDRTGSYIGKINGVFINIIICIVLAVLIVVWHRKTDIIERRK